MLYQSFKRQMLELLDYDNPSLELETLKLQIKGPKAQEALKCLYNVRSKEWAFEILDAKYGYILMVFLGLIWSWDAERPPYEYVGGVD